MRVFMRAAFLYWLRIFSGEFSIDMQVLKEKDNYMKKKRYICTILVHSELPLDIRYEDKKLHYINYVLSSHSQDVMSPDNVDLSGMLKKCWQCEYIKKLPRLLHLQYNSDVPSD